MDMQANTEQDTEQDSDLLDVQRAYKSAAECGYHRDLLIASNQAQGLAARLRGIASITAVLMTDGTDMDLGEYLRGGLVEAVHMLADDAAGVLEGINSRAEKRAAA